jgi:hypothetical protein
MRIIETGIVYRNPEPHLRSRQAFHPSLVNLGGGEILCSFDLGEAVESLDYRTYISRSMDNGQTWDFEGPMLDDLVDGPATSTVRTSRLSDGSLLGFGARFHREDPDAGLTNRETLGLVPMDLILLRSPDNGNTWGRPENLSLPLAGPGFEICHSILELPGGRLLAPTATWRGWNGENSSGEKAVVLISDDGGKSWPEYGVTFDGTDAGMVHWEQSVVSLGGDDLLAVAWAHNPENGKNLPTPYSISHDGGKSFSKPRLTGLQGQTCKALRMTSEAILCVYRRDNRPGLWANLSHLDGETWHNDDELPLWGAALKDSGMTGESNSSDELSALKFGYPSLLQVTTSEVLISFWCLEGWGSNIRWIRLSV